MTLTREQEELVRAIAGISADEAIKRAAGLAERGQDVTLAGRNPLNVHLQIPVTSAATRELGGPYRSLLVLSVEPQCAAVLRIFSYEGNARGASVDVPCYPGLHLRDVPMARVQLVVSTAASAGFATILASPVPHCLGDLPTREWAPVVIRATGTGAVAATITLTDGFEFELLAASLLLECDANAANRLPHLNVYPPDALATDAPLGTAWVDTNVTASQQAILQVIFGAGPVRQADTGISIIRPVAAATVEQFMAQSMPRWVGRSRSVASPHFETNVTNGQAGDAVTLTVLALRRPIL